MLRNILIFIFMMNERVCMSELIVAYEENVKKLLDVQQRYDTILNLIHIRVRLNLIRHHSYRIISV